MPRNNSSAHSGVQLDDIGLTWKHDKTLHLNRWQDLVGCVLSMAMGRCLFLVFLQVSVSLQGEPDVATM